MAESAAAPTQKPTKTQGKYGEGSAHSSSLEELIMKAVAATPIRISYVALLKALAAGGYDVEKNKRHVQVSIRRLVKKGELIATSKYMFCGSFKVNKVALKAKKRARAAAEAEMAAKMAAMRASAQQAVRSKTKRIVTPENHRP